MIRIILYSIFFGGSALIGSQLSAGTVEQPKTSTNNSDKAPTKIIHQAVKTGNYQLCLKHFDPEQCFIQVTVTHRNLQACRDWEKFRKPQASKRKEWEQKPGSYIPIYGIKFKSGSQFTYNHCLFWLSAYLKDASVCKKIDINPSDDSQKICDEFVKRGLTLEKLDGSSYLETGMMH